MKTAAFIVFFFGLLAIWPGVTNTINRPVASAADNRVAPVNYSPVAFTACLPPGICLVTNKLIDDSLFAELLEEDDDETSFGSRFRLIAAYFFVLFLLSLVGQLVFRDRKTISFRPPLTCLYLWQRTLRI
jgi:hypothetical protein